MKCSNVGCPHYDETAKAPCRECVVREQNATTWIENLLKSVDPVKIENAKQWERKHKKEKDE